MGVGGIGSVGRFMPGVAFDICVLLQINLESNDVGCVANKFINVFKDLRYQLKRAQFCFVLPTRD